MQQNLKKIVEEDYVSTKRCDNTATYHESVDKCRHLSLISATRAVNFLQRKSHNLKSQNFCRRKKKTVENEKDLGDWVKFETIGKRKDPPGDYNIRLDKKLHCPCIVYQVIVRHSVFVFSTSHGIRTFRQDQYQTSKCYFQSQGCLTFSHVKKRLQPESYNKLSDIVSSYRVIFDIKLNWTKYFAWGWNHKKSIRKKKLLKTQFCNQNIQEKSSITS